MQFKIIPVRPPPCLFLTAKKSRHSKELNKKFPLFYLGSRAQKILDLGHEKMPMHNLGKAYGRCDQERLFRQLVVDGILAEDLVITALDHAACYIRLGKKAQDVIGGRHKVRKYEGQTAYIQYPQQIIKKEAAPK